MNSFKAVAPWRSFVLFFVALIGLHASQGCSIWNFTAPPCAGDLNCQDRDRCLEGICVPDRHEDAGGPALSDAGLQPDSGPGLPDGGSLGQDGGINDGGINDGGDGGFDAGFFDAGLDAGVADGGVCSFVDALTAMPDQFTVTEDVGMNIDVLANDCAGANGIGFAGITRWPSQGSVFVNSDGTIYYEPYPDLVTAPGEEDTFNYRTIDSAGSTSVAEVTIEIQDGESDDVRGKVAQALMQIGSTMQAVPLPAYNPDDLELTWTGISLVEEVTFNFNSGTFDFNESAGNASGTARFLSVDVSVNSTLDAAYKTSTLEIEIAAYVWVGSDAEISPWGTETNWLPPGVPSIDDSVIIPANAGTFPTLTGPQAAASIRIDSGASIDVNGYELTVSGHLFLPANEVSIKGTGDASALKLVESITTKRPTVALMRGLIEPPLTITRAVRLNGKTELSSDLNLWSEDVEPMQLDLDQHELTVAGNFTYIDVFTDEFLRLADPRCRLIVDGNMTFSMSQSGPDAPTFELTAGTIDLGGDFTYAEPLNARLFDIDARGTRLRLMNSGRIHVISLPTMGGFSGAPKFGPIELAAGSISTFGDRLVVNGYCNVRAGSTLSSTDNTSNKIDWVSHLSPGLPNVDSANTSIRGPVQVLRATQLATKLTIAGVNATASVDVGPFPLLIGNNTTLGSEVLRVTMNEPGDALFMQDDSLVVVMGNSVFDGRTGGDSAVPRLNGGVLQLLGNLTQVDNGAETVFSPLGTLVWFRGSDNKSINFGSAGEVFSHFDNLHIEEGTVSLSSHVDVLGDLTIDAGALVVGGNTLTAASLLQITTDVAQGLFLNVASSNVLVTGNAEFITSGGSTEGRFRNGILTVRGDLLSSSTFNATGLDMRCTSCAGSGTTLQIGTLFSGQTALLDSGGVLMALSTTLVTDGRVQIAAGSSVFVTGNFDLGNNNLIVDQDATLTVSEGFLLSVSGCSLMNLGTITANGTGQCWNP